MKPKKAIKPVKVWEIQIGNILWGVVSDVRPIVRLSKMRGKEFNKIIIDEVRSPLK